MIVHLNRNITLGGQVKNLLTLLKRGDGFTRKGEESWAPFVPGTVILLNLHINQRILIIPSLRPSVLPVSTTRRRNLH